MVPHTAVQNVFFPPGFESTDFYNIDAGVLDLQAALLVAVAVGLARSVISVQLSVVRYEPLRIG